MAVVLALAANAGGQTVPAQTKAARPAGTTASGASDRRLVHALKAGDTTAATSLLRQRVDPNTADVDGTTPLHWAVRLNDAALVGRLLAAGANAAAENRNGVTAMQLACEVGSADIVGKLLDAGVAAGAVGPLGETALHTCARSGSLAASRLLVARGAPIEAREGWRGQTPLMWAAAQGHGDVVAMLLEAGGNPNARSTVVKWERQRTQEPRDKWLPPGGFAALHLAAREGRVESVRVLLDGKAAIDEVDPDRQSALVLALMNGHFDVAGLLIDRGIDVNLKDKVGRTALWAAVDSHTVPSSNRPAPRETDDDLSSLDIVEKLLARGAEVDAALSQQIPYRTKLDRGGDGVLGAGTTPLLRAAKAGDAPVVKLLLEKGANAKATTRAGVSGIMMAGNVGTREEDMTGRTKTEREAIETIGLLLAAGADVNAADTQGRTAAHGAALWGLTDVVRFLHKRGATFDVKDKRGLTPLDIALGQGGGFGFDGRASVVREETAKAIMDLTGLKPSAPGPRPTTPPSRTQDEP
jgi:ankyrin repeat protein